VHLAAKRQVCTGTLEAEVVAKIDIDIDAAIKTLLEVRNNKPGKLVKL
jgi:hypothetical protein